MSYSTVITNAGLAALAAAQSGGTPVTITHIAYGDGNGSIIVPDPAQTALTHEVHHRAINGISTDAVHPEWVVIESTIPPDIGGFTVREVGVILTDGTLFAVASYPEIYKPTPIESAGRDLYVKMILSVGNAANVTIQIDASVVTATISYVNQSILDHENKVDPHPQYLTQSDADAIYALIDHKHNINPKSYFIGGI
ncbi:phage tail protein [Sulfuricurvum sp.]|uniref:phage tail protein n=1 Tax=Sulfuricurvum sp. TaxID=2025608 RepID=UPI0026257D59|nr:phage tail protein [Sulfuricurvum sp.]MDD2267015.1 phage tail protein [Sulfuricurvum sp.]MDD2782631.1 phage tail protein [Sulfuricurvum sp.]